MVAIVARVYNGLPPDERGKTAILASYFGEVGALDFFGPRYGLPKAISTHQNYYAWELRDSTGEIMIALRLDRATAEQHCCSEEEAAVVDHPQGQGSAIPIFSVAV